jgi:CheY-like chemotaxis protein
VFHKQLGYVCWNQFPGGLVSSRRNTAHAAFTGLVCHWRLYIRQPEPCVILLDLHLPMYDGMAILRAIREAPALEHSRDRIEQPGWWGSAGGNREPRGFISKQAVRPK